MVETTIRGCDIRMQISVYGSVIVIVLLQNFNIRVHLNKLYVDRQNVLEMNPTCSLTN